MKCKTCGQEVQDRRTLEQNRFLHQLLQEISGSREWAGRKWDVLTWKRLLWASWCRAEGIQAKVLPALDGQGIDVIYEPTSRMTKQQMASLIDYISAWMYDEA